MLQETTRIRSLFLLATVFLLGAAACTGTDQTERSIGTGGTGGTVGKGGEGGQGGQGGEGGQGGSGGSGGEGGEGEAEGRLRFIDLYPAISVSADGKVVAISDQESGTNDVYFFQVATGELEKIASTEHPERYVNGFSADGKWIIGSRGQVEVPSIWSEGSGWIDLPTSTKAATVSDPVGT